MLGIFIHTVYRVYSSILYTGYIHPYCIQGIVIHTVYTVYSSILYTLYIHPFCIHCIIHPYFIQGIFIHNVYRVYSSILYTLYNSSILYTWYMFRNLHCEKNQFIIPVQHRIYPCIRCLYYTEYIHPYCIHCIIHPYCIQGIFIRTVYKV